MSLEKSKGVSGQLNKLESTLLKDISLNANVLVV